MATPRDHALGVVAAIAILIGYSVFPSGTGLEWTVVAVAFLIGMVWAAASKDLSPWRDVRGLAFASCVLIVVGAAVRMWSNDFTLADTVLLLREEKYVWGSLLPFGYWLLAGVAGYALVRAVRARTGQRHAEE